MSESNLIVLDCEKKILEEVLKQCQQVITSFFFLLGLFVWVSLISDQIFAGGFDQPGIFLLLDQPRRSHWYLTSIIIST